MVRYTIPGFFWPQKYIYIYINLKNKLLKFIYLLRGIDLSSCNEKKKEIAQA
jgi:hypothetical protein